VQAADYAWTEYGVSAEEISSFEQKAIAEHERLGKAGKLQYLTRDDIRALRKKSEKATGR